MKKKNNKVIYESLPDRDKRTIELIDKIRERGIKNDYALVSAMGHAPL